MASLTVRNLSKSFGAGKVLDDISFEVADGEFCILLGPSGCGKTTLLRAVAGLEEAESGNIVIGDKHVDSLPPRERDVAFVFQNYALYPHLNVFENLAFSLRLRRRPDKEIRLNVEETAKLLEIHELLARKPQELSGGQRQRVAVGRAIVRRPKIFLFDEPLSNLDAALRAGMRVELARLHQRLRATIVYVTHDQAEAMTLGEKIIVLNKGAIQQIGPPSEIYQRPVNTFVATFVGSPQMNLIEGTVDARGIFTSNGCKIDLSPILGERRSEFAGKPLTVGIRPEDLQPADSNRAFIEGEVELVEDLGSDKFVHLTCGSRQLISRLPPNVSVNRGDTLHLTADPTKLHLFHQGRRVG
ncbi:MAG TPA: sn-glycerol-3-phosphate ABC transporter ATP-binding protein UgpC [Candidatus Binatia bacterium]|jgi:multiple sugar transport system ATP-binding protein